MSTKSPKKEPRTSLSIFFISHEQSSAYIWELPRRKSGKNRHIANGILTYIVYNRAHLWRGSSGG
jgi:hypothetical protein